MTRRSETEILRALHAYAARTVAARMRGARRSPAQGDGLPSGYAAPEWLDPSAIEVIAIASDAPATLVIGVVDGIPLASLPTHWHHPSCRQPVALCHRRLPRAVAQGVPGVTRDRDPIERGTATCLVRDRLNPDRHYVIASGHVLAPSREVRWNDPILLTLTPTDRLPGRLREWQPDVAAPSGESLIDAGLVEIDAGTLRELRAIDPRDWLPTGIDDRPAPGRAITVRTVREALAGTLGAAWAGKVSLADSPDYPDYFLHDAIGYRTRQPTLAGDSGAPVWTDADALLGMHIAGIDDAEPGSPNAVLGRIAPVLDWYCVKAYTRDDPATLTDADRPRLSRRLETPAPAWLPAPAPGATPDESQIATVARTLWGEARGEGQQGMEAVAAVIANRARTGYRGCHDARAVCLDRKQFSCWNENDPNRRRLDQLDAFPDESYRLAREIALRMLEGKLPDPTYGSRHYLTVTAMRTCDWTRGKTPRVVIGKHAFFNDIA